MSEEPEGELDPGDVCPRAGDPRDPAYDPWHDWEEIGDAGGETVYECRRCNKSKLGW